MKVADDLPLSFSSSTLFPKKFWVWKRGENSSINKKSLSLKNRKRELAEIMVYYGTSWCLSAFFRAAAYSLLTFSGLIICTFFPSPKIHAKNWGLTCTEILA